ncbi:MAG TPA: DUF3570 domain-containing protein [Polyangiaceae bacterium]
MTRIRAGAQGAREAGAACAVLIASLLSSAVRAEGMGSVAKGGPAFDPGAILGHPRNGIRVESVMTRITAFEQDGHGFQSQAGPLLGAGSEHATILEPVVEVRASQGERVRHVFTVPVDVVTAASPDAVDSHRPKPDVVSAASRQNYAGTIDWNSSYKANRETEIGIRSGVHLEEPFRSWHGGFSFNSGFADGATVLSASVLEVFDWFDNFDILGHRNGRTNRASTTGSVGITQILTPTTLVVANYGLTVQEGQLGNTWNSVPLASGKRGAELLPSERVRHALVARASQFLPWNGALRVYYRFYSDDWGILAHTAEVELMQRILPSLYVGALYRQHWQKGADFFTTLAAATATLRTSDSDLDQLTARTVGGRVVMDFPLDAGIRVLHIDMAWERYLRSNDLRANVVTWGTGYRF